MSTILLKNLRNTLLDLSAVNDVHGKRILLAPAGKNGDSAEADEKAAEHPNVKAMKDAKWLEVGKPSLKAKVKEKLQGEATPPTDAPAEAPPAAPPAEDAPPVPPVLPEAQAAVDAAPPADTGATENVAGVDNAKVESSSDDPSPTEGGKKKKRW